MSSHPTLTATTMATTGTTAVARLAETTWIATATRQDAKCAADWYARPRALEMARRGEGRLVMIEAVTGSDDVPPRSPGQTRVLATSHSSR